MKPHKHADLIHAWADGAIIEARYLKATGWSDWQEEIGGFFWYESNAEYRIKPKPDYKRYFVFHPDRPCIYPHSVDEPANIILIFDGNTDKLKDAKVSI